MGVQVRALDPQRPPLVCCVAVHSGMRPKYLDLLPPGAPSVQVGLVLVKELLQYRLGSSGDVPVSMLRMRSIPR